MTERILVGGGGAAGGVAAMQTMRAGHDTTVLDADRDHTAVLRNPGLLLVEVSDDVDAQ